MRKNNGAKLVFLRRLSTIIQMLEKSLKDTVFHPFWS